jgi:PKD repeat protein
VSKKTAALTPGTYVWRAIASDSSLSSVPVESYFTVISPDQPPNYMCKIDTLKGTAPLTIEVETTVIQGTGALALTPPYSYSFDFASTQKLNTANPTYFTYTETGTYNVKFKVKDSGTTETGWTDCGTVKVNSSSGDDGGEVAP